MKGNKILLTVEPKGAFKEGTISGTPKPGTVMMKSPGVEPVNGRFTYVVYNTGGDGEPRQIIVLLEDSLQGKTTGDAYVSGTRGFMYCPVSGDELNMLLLDVGGTGDDHTIGERLQVDDGTGKLVTQATSASKAPFECCETLTDPTADALAWCEFTGY